MSRRFDVVHVGAWLLVGVALISLASSVGAQPFRPRDAGAEAAPASQPTSQPTSRPEGPVQVRLRAVLLDNTARARAFHQSGGGGDDPTRYAMPNQLVKIHTYDLEGNVEVVTGQSDPMGIVDMDLGTRLSGTKYRAYVEGLDGTRYLSLPVTVSSEPQLYLSCYQVTEDPAVLTQRVNLIVTDTDAVDEETNVGSVQVRQIVFLNNASLQVYVGPPDEDPVFSFMIPEGAEVTSLMADNLAVDDTQRRNFQRFSPGVAVDRPIYPSHAPSDELVIIGTYTVPAVKDEEVELSYMADVPIRQFALGVEIGIVHYVPEHQDGVALTKGQQFGGMPRMPQQIQLYDGANLPAGTFIPMVVRYGSPPLRPLDPVTLLVSTILWGGVGLAVMFGILIGRARSRMRRHDSRSLVAELDRQFAHGEIDAVSYRRERQQLVESPLAPPPAPTSSS